MKNPKFRPVHKKREITTNCARDTHKEFCKRCLAYNKECPAKNPKECDL